MGAGALAVEARFLEGRVLDQIGVVPQEDQREATFELLGDGDRQAVLAADPFRHVVRASLELLGEALHRRGAALRLPLRPALRILERAACPGHGGIHVCLLRFGDRPDRLFGAG